MGSLKEKICLGCNTLPEDNPFHTCGKQPPKEWEKRLDEKLKLAMDNSIDEGIDIYDFCMDFIRQLLQEEKQKWIEEIESERNREDRKRI